MPNAMCSPQHVYFPIVQRVRKVPLDACMMCEAHVRHIEQVQCRPTEVRTTAQTALHRKAFEKSAYCARRGPDRPTGGCAMLSTLRG